MTRWPFVICGVVCQSWPPVVKNNKYVNQPFIYHWHRINSEHWNNTMHNNTHVQSDGIGCHNTAPELPTAESRSCGYHAKHSDWVDIINSLYCSLHKSWQQVISLMQQLYLQFMCHMFHQMISNLHLQFPTHMSRATQAMTNHHWYLFIQLRTVVQRVDARYSFPVTSLTTAVTSSSLAKPAKLFSPKINLMIVCQIY